MLVGIPNLFDPKEFSPETKAQFLNKYKHDPYSNDGGDMFLNCISDYFELKYSKLFSPYIQYKDQGNIALKDNNNSLAIQLYSKALIQCHSYTVGLKYLNKLSKQEIPKLSKSGNLLFSNVYLVAIISSYLKLTVPIKLKMKDLIDMTVNLPNKAAAICYTNRSIAYLNMNNHKQALSGIAYLFISIVLLSNTYTCIMYTIQMPPKLQCYALNTPKGTIER